MHYKNGKPAKIGDKIVGMNTMGQPVAGYVVATSEVSDTCNLQVIPCTYSAYTMTAGECLLFEDAIK